MSNAEPSLAWRLLWQTVNFKSVNITDVVISESTMSPLVMELFICLGCAVILLEHRTTLLQCAIKTLPELLKTVTKVTF